MADNVPFTPGTGATGATDDIGGVHYPRVKIALGGDGTAVDAGAGAGAVGTDTQRVTLGSDDPLVAAVGAAADAASATTTVSAKLRGIATALGITALDLGSGTGGSRTLRFFKDTAQWIGGAGSVTSATMRATLASDDPAVAGLGATSDSAATAGSTGSINAKLRLMTTQLASLTRALDGDYETVAASQTDQMLGATGAAGDYLAGVLIIPATTSPGAVSIEDGATNIPIFTGGANSVTNLVPFFVPLGIVSVSGGWEITTGTNVAVIGVGSFT